jgi:hypothetical protein
MEECHERYTTPTLPFTVLEAAAEDQKPDIRAGALL